MVRRFDIAILSLVVLAFAAPNIRARNLVGVGYGDKHRSLFGIKFGLLNASTIKIDGVEFDTDYGLTGGVFFDLAVTRGTMFGFTADILDVQAFSYRQKAIDVGVALKFPIYPKKSQIAIRPGIGAGYMYLAHIEGLLESSDYISMKIFVEAGFYSVKRWAWLMDFGVYYAPDGGNSQYDISYGPVVFVRGGVMY